MRRGQERAGRGGGQRRVSDKRAAVEVARKSEVGRRVLPEQREVGRFRAAGHRQSAAEVVGRFGKGFLRPGTESDVSKVAPATSGAGC